MTWVLERGVLFKKELEASMMPIIIAVRQNGGLV